MKIATLILLLAGTAFAATSVYLTQRASADRNDIDKIAAERTALSARVSQLEQERDALLTEVQSLRAPTAARVAPPASAPNAPAAEPARRVFSAFGTSQGGVFRNFGSAGPSPPMPPAMRKVMQKQMREHVWRHYEDVGAELGLTEEQSARLVDIFAEQNVFDPFETPETMQQRAAESRRKQEAAVKALIGADKMPQFAEYQKSIGARAELGQFQEQLAAENLPLETEQRKQLVSAMMEEQQRNPQPKLERTLPPEDVQAQFTAWQDERDERLLDSARSVLTSKQLEVFREYQKYQRAIRQRFVIMAPINGEQGMSMSAVAVAPAVSFSASGGGSTQPER